MERTAVPALIAEAFCDININEGGNLEEILHGSNAGTLPGRNLDGSTSREPRR